jgi:hypothetical protein
MSEINEGEKMYERVMMLQTVELSIEGGGKITYPQGHLHLVDEELAYEWCVADPPLAVREDEISHEEETHG